MSNNKLTFKIFKLENDDFLIYTYSTDAQEDYETLCNGGLADGGDLYIESSTLTSDYSYAMFSLKEYRELISGPLDKQGDIFKARFTVGSPSIIQPQEFILRFYNGTKKFTDSFSFRAGNSGLYFGTGINQVTFISDADAVYTASADGQTGAQSKTYETLFFILLAIVVCTLIYQSQKK